MAIERIGASSTAARSLTTPETKTGGSGFGEMVAEAAKQVSGLENQANQMAEKVARGDVMELHNAMLAMSRASSALELTVQVRNKVLEAYQEIMRMQI